MSAGDPLLGGAAPGVANPQASAAPATPPATPAVAQAQAVPPLPPINPTASNAALAAGPQPLDGGRDLRIGDSRPPADGRGGWQAQPVSGPVPARIPGAAPAEPSNRPDSVNAHSFGPSPASRIASYEQAQWYLASRGVNWQRLENSADLGEWKFSCSVPNPQNRNINRTYEAKARDYLSAIRAVIDQLSREQ
jgi:hypothetical protein